MDWRQIRLALLTMPVGSKEEIAGVQAWRTAETQWNIALCDHPLGLHDATCEINTDRKRREVLPPVPAPAGEPTPNGRPIIKITAFPENGQILWEESTYDGKVLRSGGWPRPAVYNQIHAIICGLLKGD